MLDNIESNVASVAINVENATGELRTARKYQLSTRSRLCWFLMIALVVLFILILMLQPWNWWKSG
jgi:syntaxin 7